MKSKKIDVSNLIYIIVMVVVFMIGLNSCASYRYKKNKEVVPSPKFGFWNGLKVSEYQSNEGFNYLEDAITTFPNKSSN